MNPNLGPLGQSLPWQLVRPGTNQNNQGNNQSLMKASKLSTAPLTRQIPNMGMAMNMNIPPFFLPRGQMQMDDISRLLSQNKPGGQLYFQNMIPRMSMYGKYL